MILGTLSFSDINYSIFGIFLLIGSLYVKLLIGMFGFFETFFGRAIFLFFMASLSFSGWPHWAMIIVGIVFVFASVIHFVISFSASEVSIRNYQECSGIYRVHMMKQLMARTLPCSKFQTFIDNLRFNIWFW